VQPGSGTVQIGSGESARKLRSWRPQGVPTPVRDSPLRYESRPSREGIAKVRDRPCYQVR
jgi:hypothetical protein